MPSSFIFCAALGEWSFLFYLSPALYRLVSAECRGKDVPVAKKDRRDRCCFARSFFACFFLFGWLGGLLSLVLLIGPCLLVRQYRRQMPPDLGQLKKMVRLWQAGNGGGDEMLLLQPSLHEPPAAFPEKDLFDYGVERIILVERRLLVDLLVRNGFHADQNALIFSRDGYPAYIVQRAQKMLKEDASLPVYLLHDASEAGMAMVQKKRLSGRVVIDLGIRPEHVEKMHFLKALQLDRKGYKAPLDILPYPIMATICGQALYEKRTLSEVLEQWSTRSARRLPWWMQRGSVGQKKTSRQGV